MAFHLLHIDLHCLKTPFRKKKEERDHDQGVDLLEDVGDIQGADPQVLTDLVGVFIEEVNI